MNKIAVILCGSGFRDGSEIRESVAVLWALSQLEITPDCFAPDAAQFDVVNCLLDEVAPSESRNQLVEAARIARGNIRPLDQLEAKDFDAVIIPGGFGVAKNLCNFAAKGAQATVIPDLEKTLRDFHHAKKPIGAICIAPAVLALAFKGLGLELTVGKNSEVSQEIVKLGHRHIETDVTQCHTDQSHRVVTTAAYMDSSAPLHHIFQGISKLVNAVIGMIRN